MSNQKSAILLLCFGLLSGTLFSQKIFREGYVLRNSGEMVEGLVSWAPGEKIPGKCLFKRFEIAVTLTYTPDIIKAFGFKNGRRFETFNYKGKNLFFETLVSGELSLYTNGNEYFLRKSGSEIQELKGSISWNDEKGSRKFVNPEELLVYLAEGTKFEKAGKDDLKKVILPLVAENNTASGEKYVVYNRSVTEKEITASAWRSNSNTNRVGVSSGMNLYSLNLSSKKKIYLPSPEIESCGVFGISYERVLSRRSDNLTANAELLYHNQTFYSFAEEINIYDRFTKNDAFFNYKALKVPLMLRYTFSERRIKPFVNAGFAGTFFLQSKYLHICEKESYHGTSIEINEDSELIFKPYEISGLAGTGINFRAVNTINLRLEARIEFGSGIFSNKDKSFFQYSLQQTLLLGIVF